MYWFICKQEFLDSTHRRFTPQAFSFIPLSRDSLYERVRESVDMSLIPGIVQRRWSYHWTQPNTTKHNHISVNLVLFVLKFSLRLQISKNEFHFITEFYRTLPKLVGETLKKSPWPPNGIDPCALICKPNQHPAHFKFKLIVDFRALQEEYDVYRYAVAKIWREIIIIEISVQPNKAIKQRHLK